LTEGEIKSITGNEAETVTIHYGNRYSVTYKYDRTNETYTRFNGDEQSVDYETETPITLDNVFIVETAHRVIDNAGRREIDVTSGGDALLLQKGIVQFVEWENDNGRIVPKTSEGSAGFVPGKTWINVIPDDPGIENDVDYEMNRN